MCLLSKSKRVQVAFTESQWKLLEKLRGVFGDGDADIVRNIHWSSVKRKTDDRTRMTQMTRIRADQ